MMFSDNDELSEQERIAIAALPHALAPSGILEERVVRALRNEGHFGTVARAPRQWSRHLMKAAAAIALFAGGVATGHYLLSQPSAATATRADSQPRISTPAPHSSNGAQPVKNTETVVAEREMWL